MSKSLEQQRDAAQRAYQRALWSGNTIRIAATLREYQDLTNRILRRDNRKRKAA